MELLVGPGAQVQIPGDSDQAWSTGSWLEVVADQTKRESAWSAQKSAQVREALRVHEMDSVGGQYTKGLGHIQLPVFKLGVYPNSAPDNSIVKAFLLLAVFNLGKLHQVLDLEKAYLNLIFMAFYINSSCCLRL